MNTELQSHLVEHAFDRSGLNGFTVDPFQSREHAFDGPTSLITMRFRPVRVSGNREFASAFHPIAQSLSQEIVIP